jgi:hypothetical protein
MTLWKLRPRQIVSLFETAELKMINRIDKLRRKNHWT